MRKLGIDYGDSRVGLAITDELGITAQGLETVNHKGNDKIVLKRLEEIIYFSKNDISSDDVIVWNETSRDLKSKNISFYAVILDSENGSFTTYNNLKASIPYLQINSNTDVFEAVNKIEQFNKGLEYEEEMEM